MPQRLVVVADVPPRAAGFAGVQMRVLHTDADGGFLGVADFAPGAVVPRHVHARADEAIYVMTGELLIEGRACGPGSFLAVDAGTPHGPHGSPHGCTITFWFSAPLDMQILDDA